METESANPFTCTKITFPRCAEESRPEAEAQVVVGVGEEQAAAETDSTGTERPIGAVFAVTHTHAVEFLSLRVAVSVCGWVYVCNSLTKKLWESHYCFLVKKGKKQHKNLSILCKSGQGIFIVEEN
uniref:(northern house mosquito) hypothetical protein n=1 Tax=Culex pipiens TaxID=7175 RepID=A0A8D8I7G8_CULPI